MKTVVPSFCSRLRIYQYTQVNSFLPIHIKVGRRQPQIIKVICFYYIFFSNFSTCILKKYGRNKLISLFTIFIKKESCNYIYLCLEQINQERYRIITCIFLIHLFQKTCDTINKKIIKLHSRESH